MKKARKKRTDSEQRRKERMRERKISKNEIWKKKERNVNNKIRLKESVIKRKVNESMKTGKN